MAYFVQYSQLHRPCATDIVAESNTGQSGPENNGHQAMGGLARFHSSCERSYLRKHYDNGTCFRQAYSKVCIEIIHRPRYIDTSPVLSDRPIGAEKPSAVNVLEMFEKIFVRDPKYLEDGQPHVVSNKRCNEHRRCRTGD